MNHIKYNKYKNKYLKIKKILVGGNNKDICECKISFENIKSIDQLRTNINKCKDFLSKIINSNIIIKILNIIKNYTTDLSKISCGYDSDEYIFPVKDIVELILKHEYIYLHDNKIIDIFKILFNNFAWYQYDFIFLFLFNIKFTDKLNNYLDNNNILSDRSEQEHFITRIIINIDFYEKISFLNNYKIFKKLIKIVDNNNKQKLFLILKILNNNIFISNLKCDSLLKKYLNYSPVYLAEIISDNPISILFKIDIELFKTDIGLFSLDYVDYLYRSKSIEKKMAAYLDTYIMTDIEHINVYEINKNTNIYHGTFSNIKNGKINIPAFYSTDIVQSLSPLYAAIIGNIYFNNNDFKQSHLKKRGYDYYPLIYIYKLQNNENLLLLDYPNNDKFKKLYHPKILAKYLFKKDIYTLYYIIQDIFDKETQKHKNINYIQQIIKLYEFIIYIQNISGDLLSNKFIILIIKIKFINFLEEYKNVCDEGCFGSYYNIIGYYLLSCINFNLYFREINIINSSTTITGIYVPNDQNEIIFLNNDNLLLDDIIYGVPYYFKNYILNNSKYHLQCKIKEYITKYAYLIKEYNKIEDNTLKEEFIKTNLLQHLFQLIIIKNNTLKYIEFNKSNFDEHKQNNIWFFDFLTSNCTDIYPNTYNTNNCDTYNDIYPGDNNFYKMFYDKQINYPNNFVSKSYAYGIVNENYENNKMDKKKLCYLKDYINFLHTYCTAKTLKFKLNNDWEL